MFALPLLAALVLTATPPTPVDEAIAQAAHQPKREARETLDRATAEAMAAEPPPGGSAKDNARLLARLSRAWSDVADPADPGGKAAARRAVDLAERAVKADPHNAQAHLALAIAAGKWTDYVDAKTKVTLSRQIRVEAETAIALDPKLDLAYHVLGRWHLGMAGVNPFLRFGARMTVGALPPASMEEAARNLEKAAELSPRTIIHHQYLAQAYLALHRKADAARQWQIVLSLPAQDHEDELAQKEARAALGR